MKKTEFMILIEHVNNLEIQRMEELKKGVSTEVELVNPGAPFDKKEAFYKKFVRLNSPLDEILFGCLLGDAFAHQVHEKGGTRIRFGVRSIKMVLNIKHTYIGYMISFHFT